jgi:hypothetical protein
VCTLVNVHHLKGEDRMTDTFPAYMEVFGEDGEVTWISTHDASAEAIQDAIELLESRVASIRGDIEALQKLKLRRASGERK